MLTSEDTRDVKRSDYGAPAVENQEAQESELSDAALEAVAGGTQAPRKFYPLAELFRMITGIR